MNIKSLGIFLLITMGVLLGVGGLLWQFGQTTDKPVEDVAGAATHKRGEGKITLVEFSDFQCPACLSIQTPLKEMLARYEGKVSLIYRHFPLSSIHQNAQAAAQAAEAAHLQGKFWEMHDWLFEKQGEWSGLGDLRSKFGEYASALGMDQTKFDSDWESQPVKDAVAIDLLAATRYRLTGTPTFFVNGVKTEFNQIELKLSELVGQ